MEKLRIDPDVAAVEPVLQVRPRITNPNAPPEDDERGGPGGPRGSAPGRCIEGHAQPGGSVANDVAASRQPTLVGTDAAEPPHELVAGRWIDPTKREPAEGVITSGSAELLKVKLNDEVVVGDVRGDGELRFKIVGIAEQPKTLPPPKFMIGLPPRAMRRCAAVRPVRPFTSRANWR